MQKLSLFQSYIDTVISLIKEYRGDIPLPDFLKKYFAQHKKFGSRDRKQIINACYCFYRLGKALPGLEAADKILDGLFLCSGISSPLLQHLKPGYNENIALNLLEKASLLSYPFAITDIFPFGDALSEGVNDAQLSAAMLVQPDMFLRIRPGKKKIVLKYLQDECISSTQITESCLALPNSTKLDDKYINSDFVIQDYSSQRIEEFLSLVKQEWEADKSSIKKVWDCCAASGGKSILAYDTLNPVALTVSDIRESILQNLNRRFREADIKNYHSFTADLTHKPDNQAFFDLVICDVPCSGSGTWARTPEQLYFFSPDEIQFYAHLQKKIITNSIQYLRKGGFFLYITCSVFREENEKAVQFIEQQFGMQTVKQELLTGYSLKADTMFAALFKKE